MDDASRCPSHSDGPRLERLESIEGSGDQVTQIYRLVHSLTAIGDPLLVTIFNNRVGDSIVQTAIRGARNR